MNFLTFLNNLRYLFRFNLKEIYLKQEKLLKNESLSINEDILLLIEKIKSETKNEWNEILVPQIENNFETINKLVNSSKSLIRFGDGEFRLMKHEDIPFQKANNDLSKKLIEIITSNDENLLIGIPFEYFKTNVQLRKSVKTFMYTWVPKWLKFIEKYIQRNKIYYSTSISQVYAMYEKYDFEKHFSLLKQIWNDKKITIITGDKVLNKIDNNIFFNAQEINYIYGPTLNAYEKYEKLKNELFQLPKEQLLIFAIGPAGKILAYDCFKNGYRVLDLGHVIKDYDTYKKDIFMNEQEIIKFFSPD